MIKVIKVATSSILSTLFLLAQINLIFAQTASILPPAKTTFFDNNGNPLVNGKVYFFNPGTTTNKTTWQDSAETIPNTNPVTLDSSGRAIILGDGTYRQRVFDRNNNLIWDQQTASGGSGSGGGTATVGDGDSVGTVKPWAGFTAPNQYVFSYGQEMARASFPELFAAITSQQNVSCTSGSPTLSGLSDTSQIPIGAHIETSCVNAGTTVIAKGLSTLTASSNAIISTSTTIRIFPYGNGDGSLTFNTPDLRGRTLAGRDNMGGVSANRLTTTFFANAAGIGVVGGSQSQTLTLTNLPPNIQSLSASPITVTANTANKNFATTAGTISGNQTGGGAQAASANTTAGGAGDYQTASSMATNGVIGVTSSNTGSGGVAVAFGVVQPTELLNYIIKAIPDSNPNTFFGVASIGGMTGVITCGTGVTCAGNNISAVVAGVPAPTASTLGGVFSNTCAVGFVYSIDTFGNVNCRAVVGADLPNPSTVTLGGIFSLPSVSNSVITGIDNTGTPSFATTTGTGNVVRTTGPSISGPSIINGMAVAGDIAQTTQSASALMVGRQGILKPVLQVDSSNASSITGIDIIGQATGNGVNVTAIGETNVPIIFNGAGNGTINFSTTSTGVVNSFRNFNVLHDSNPTLTLGLAGGSLAHLATPGTSGLSIDTNTSVSQVLINHTASANRQLTLTGSNGGNPTIGTSAGNLAITPAVIGASSIDGTMAATSIKCNTTGGTAISTDCTAAQVRTLTEQGSVLLAVLTASSSANLSDTTHITSSFDDYMLTFNNVVPATNAVGLNCLVHSGGSFPATSYVNGAGGSTTFMDVTSAGATVVNTAGLGVTGTLYLRNVNSTSVNKFIDGRTYHASAGPAITASNPVGYWGGGQGAVDGFQCQFTSGNMATGNIKLYGLRSAL